jgi:hypothetical protein
LSPLSGALSRVPAYAVWRRGSQLMLDGGADALASAGRIAYPVGAKAYDRARMSKSKAAPARTSRPSLAGSAEIDAMVARTAPAVLALLGDGTPRPKSAIITALADRHPKEDVTRTLMRLAVTGQLDERERKYSLASAQEAEAARRLDDPESGGG